MTPAAPRAFTLIELLVVITIIVVLLALLAPALDQAIEQAERAVCASQLHAWGVSIAQYSLDHRNRLLSSLRNRGDDKNAGVYPNLAWGDNGSQLGYDNVFHRLKLSDWSAETMQPYIQRGDFARRQYGEMWHCPSNPTSPQREEHNKRTVDNAQGGWFVSGYAYFARADIWGAEHATRPDELVGRSRESGRILMADAIHYSAGPAAWWFNHGLDGPSTYAAAFGGPVQTGVPRIAGTNQLFADGSAGWKDGNRFDPDAMFERAADDRYVSANPGPNPNGNLNFW